MKKIWEIPQRFAEAEFIIVGVAVALVSIYSAGMPWALLIALLFWPLRRITQGYWSRRTPVDWPVLLILIAIPLTLWASSVPAKTIPQVLRLLLGIALFYAVVNVTSLPFIRKVERDFAPAGERPVLKPNLPNVGQDSNPARLHSTEDIAQDSSGLLQTHATLLRDSDRGTALRFVVDAILTAGLALALLSPFVTRWNATKLGIFPAAWYSRFSRLPVDTANPNVMAGSLVFLLPLAVGLLAFSWQTLKRWERILALVFVLIGSLMLVLTQSRGAWMAYLAALALLVILRFRWGWTLAVAGVLVGVSLAGFIGFQHVAGLLAGGTTLGGLDGRLEVWSRAVYMIQDFPITGIGMGAYTEVADRLYPFLLYAPGIMEHAHNLFLQVAADLGLPGLIAWLAVLFGSLVSAWRASRSGKGQRLYSTERLYSTKRLYSTENAWLWGVGAGLLAAQVALIVHGMTDSVTWGMVRSAPLVWLIWGVCAAVAV